MISRLLGYKHGQNLFPGDSGWGFVSEPTTQHASPDDGHDGRGGRHLLAFTNNLTGTEGIVRRGVPGDQAGLEEVLEGAKVNKKELLDQAGISFDQQGGFLDDMRNYIHQALTDPSVLSYVAVVSRDNEAKELPESAGLTWVSPMRLPPNSHIFPNARDQYPSLQNDSSQENTATVRSIGAVVVHADLRRRGIADFMYVAMLEEMRTLGVEHLTFEIYHLLATVRMGIDEAMPKSAAQERKPFLGSSDQIDYEGSILNQQNVPSTKMHEEIGMTQIGWVLDKPKVITGDALAEDQLTHFLSRLYIMNVEEALAKLRQKLAGKFELKGNLPD